MEDHAEKNILTNTFIKLGTSPVDLTFCDIDIINNFIRQIYFPHLVESESLPELRLKSFLKSASNDMRMILPSKDAVIMHTKRACYQAGYLWAESLADIDLPDPCLWGWKKSESGNLVAQWLSQTGIFNLETFISTCSCKSKKCVNCKCGKSNIACLPLCH